MDSQAVAALVAYLRRELDSVLELFRTLPDVGAVEPLKSRRRAMHEIGSGMLTSVEFVPLYDAALAAARLCADLFVVPKMEQARTDRAALINALMSRDEGQIDIAFAVYQVAVHNLGRFAALPAPRTETGIDWAVVQKIASGAKGKTGKGFQYIAEKMAPVPLADLTTLLKWDSADDSWDKLRQRINKHFEDAQEPYQARRFDGKAEIIRPVPKKTSHKKIRLRQRGGKGA